VPVTWRTAKAGVLRRDLPGVEEGGGIDAQLGPVAEHQVSRYSADSANYSHTALWGVLSVPDHEVLLGDLGDDAVAVEP